MNAPVNAPAPPDMDSLTPAMRQYWRHKTQAGEALLLFRMGDFYELFHDDAVLAAELLGITLTSRDKGRTPLAGIPYHALDGYLAKLVAAGRKVAISEQVSDPQAGRGVVERALVRIVTPGTLTDDALLDQTRSNLLAAVWDEAEEVLGLATVELSTGELSVALLAPEALPDEVARLGVAEVLLPEPPSAGRHPLAGPLSERIGATITHRPRADFHAQRARSLIEQQFEVRGLHGFGFEAMDASLQACGALLSYVRETQQGAARHLQPPRRRQADDHLILDESTLRSLEVERTIRGGQRRGSLLYAVDRTRTAMGARLLRRWLCFPLRSREAITARQRLIRALRAADGLRGEARGALREIGDVERIAGRIGLQRTHARELRALGDALARLPALRTALRRIELPEIESLTESLEGLDDLAIEITTALLPEPATALREGGLFADGRHAELDRLRAIARDGQTWLAEYQRREIERSGIASLKVGFNQVFGYYIEVTHAQRERVPSDYHRKQTLKNAERYITDELKRFEGEALTAEARANDLEYELFVQLRDHVATHLPRIQQAAGALAAIDVLAAFADLARQRDFCEPEFVDQPVLEIDDGRHPVLDVELEGAFVPNDVQLAAGAPAAEGDAGKGEPIQRASPGLLLITGPNMAGKSTYIRQVALLTLLAHCGAWVPARRMRLGVVDRIFTRVGASDELARGQSTFMVEMLETANILHNATRDSLVILDEVGRGTSTFDGLSLAWAICERLATHTRCRALFATHYHELTELEELIDGVANRNVAVRETEDDIAFLHRIVPGPADRSYGLHVAKLAGVPRDVLERANAVLNELEQTFGRESRRPVLAAVQRRRQRQLRLFEAPEETIVRELRQLDAAGLDPATGSEHLRRWRKLLGLEA